MIRQRREPTKPFLTLDDNTLVDQCDVDRYRSRGPGGQKRNKTSSAVRLRHRPTGLIVIAAEDRSQHVNKARALRRLRQAIALNLRAEVDPGSYTRSELLSSCIGDDGRLHVGRRDPRYFLAVSEVLDVLQACGWRVSEATGCLGTSTGHLLKFIQNDPKLWERVNRMRAAVGEKPLR